MTSQPEPPEPPAQPAAEPAQSGDADSEEQAFESDGSASPMEADPEVDESKTEPVAEPANVDEEPETSNGTSPESWTHLTWCLAPSRPHQLNCYR